MDERQQQIREGAGREESRLNVEFIDWLQKWSTPILIVVAVVALCFVGYRKYEQRRIARIDEAFTEYNLVMGSGRPHPESLKEIATGYKGQRAVPSMARMAAADQYLRAVRLGAKVSAQPGNDGSYSAEDALGDDERQRYLTEAEGLYRTVFDENASDPAKAVLAIGAAYGLAAVAETKGDAAAAKSAYELVIRTADPAGFADHVKVAGQRIEGLADIGKLPRIYANAELPAPPVPPAPPSPLTLPSFTPTFTPDTSTPLGGTPEAAGPFPFSIDPVTPTTPQGTPPATDPTPAPPPANEPPAPANPPPADPQPTPAPPK